MAVASILSIDTQELIARVSHRILETADIVAITRALVRETRRIMESYSLSYENDWASLEIIAHCGPVQN